MSSKPQFSETERTAAQRRETVQWAIGLAKSQGGSASPELVALYRRYIAGEITLGTVRAEVERLYPQQPSNDPYPPYELPPSPLIEHLPALLWDVAPETIDPQKMARTIVQRVIQRGSPQAWAAMLDYYGRDVVQQVVETVPYLSDAAIAAVCEVFGLQKEQLRCWQRKQSIPQTFNS